MYFSRKFANILLDTMILTWVIIFVVSIAVLVKGADWFLVSAERIGLSIGISPFVVGVVIVGIGTSFPELVSSFVAVIRGVSEIVPANAVGSNIANILLIVGLSAIVSGRYIVVSKDLIDLDLPLLAASTAFVLGVFLDKQVTFGEAVLLIFLYFIYILYTTLQRRGESEETFIGILPSRPIRRGHLTTMAQAGKDLGKKMVSGARGAHKDVIMLIVGLVLLVGGAKYLIDSVIALSMILNIGAGVISLVAISFGTSLPELIVSIRAVLQKKYEMALGTVFGSNVFNVLVVVGLPALFYPLTVDDKTYSIGLPMLAVATFLFIISGISKRIHIWEGFFYVALYVLFVAKTFALF